MILWSDEFGGVYIDGDGHLNIGVVADSSRIKSLRAKSNYGGQVRYVKQIHSSTATSLRTL
ncbi:MAG: hypothetical protein FWE84_00815 [Firmicutes bacterium]|nr:hypothetical protein [Bacillota bacterium]